MLPIQLKRSQCDCLQKLKTRISKGSAWSWKHSLWILMMQRSLQVEWHWPPVPFPKVQLRHFAPEKDCLSAQTSVTQPVNMWHVSSAGSVLVESSNNCQNCLAGIVWRRSSLCGVLLYRIYSTMFYKLCLCKADTPSLGRKSNLDGRGRHKRGEICHSHTRQG